MQDKIEIYKCAVEKAGLALKGKNMLYTSANGHMFSQLNKDGELGIRFSKDDQAAFFKELNTTYFKSYGAVMKGYVLMPVRLWDDPDALAEYLKKSYDYVLTLEPK